MGIMKRMLENEREYKRRYNGQGHQYDKSELDAFEKGWTDFMIDIWREKMAMLNINNTGALRNSLTGHISGDEGQRKISHKFLMYGIYVALGVGRGYEPGNGGDLEFLSPSYREEHGLDKPRKRGPAWGGGMTSGKPRKPRDWFAKKYFYSMKRLIEKEAEYYGESYNGTLVEAIATLFEEGKTPTLTNVKNVIQM